MIQLRPYQEKARYKINRLLNSGRHPLLVKPTGTGKTITGTAIIQDRISLKNRLLVLVPQLEIFDQWLTECSTARLNPGYINDEGVRGRGRSVYICMVQSLDNILNSLPEKFCQSISEIVIDECHHSGATTWQNIYTHLSHCRRFGLTATPYRMDNHPLAPYFTDMVEPIKMSQAIKNKSLCKPIIIIPEEYQNVVPENNDFNPNDQREYIKEKKIIGDMIKAYKDVFNGLPVIIPCTTTEHAQNVTQLYRDAGWIVEHIHSKMSKYERQGVIRRVKEGKINILVTVGVGVEGMDIPGLYGIIWMRYTESLTVYMQFNGRAMRPAPGKKHFVMIDPVGNSVIHGRCDLDRKWSLETDYMPGQDLSDAPGMQLCPVCSVMNSSVNEYCHICGYSFVDGTLDGMEVDKKKRKLPSMIDGNLVYLDEDDAGNGGGNGKRKVINKDIHDINNETAELTKTEKMKILSRDLTGMKIKSKFREGLKWL